MKKKKHPKPPNSGINPQWAKNRQKHATSRPERKSWYLTIPGCEKPVWLPNFTDMDKFEKWFDGQIHRNSCMGCGWCLECRRRDEELGMYPEKTKP